MEDDKSRRRKRPLPTIALDGLKPILRPDQLREIIGSQGVSTTSETLLPFDLDPSDPLFANQTTATASTQPPVSLPVTQTHLNKDTGNTTRGITPSSTLEESTNSGNRDLKNAPVQESQVSSGTATSGGIRESTSTHSKAAAEPVADSTAVLAKDLSSREIGRKSNHGDGDDMSISDEERTGNVKGPQQNIVATSVSPTVAAAPVTMVPDTTTTAQHTTAPVPAPYVDHSKDPINTENRYSGKFASQVYNMLRQADRYFSDVVSWTPNGRSFTILKRNEFYRDVVPKYLPDFGVTNFAKKMRDRSFFYIRAGLYRNSYYNELFLRGRPDLLTLIPDKKVHQTAPAPPSFGGLPECNYTDKEMEESEIMGRPNQTGEPMLVEEAALSDDQENAFMQMLDKDILEVEEKEFMAALDDEIKLAEKLDHANRVVRATRLYPKSSPSWQSDTFSRRDFDERKSSFLEDLDEELVSESQSVQNSSARLENADSQTWRVVIESTPKMVQAFGKVISSWVIGRIHGCNLELLVRKGSFVDVQLDRRKPLGMSLDEASYASGQNKIRGLLVRPTTGGQLHNILGIKGFSSENVSALVVTVDGESCQTMDEYSAHTKSTTNELSLLLKLIDTRKRPSIFREQRKRVAPVNMGNKPTERIVAFRTKIQKVIWFAEDAPAAEGALKESEDSGTDTPRNEGSDDYATIENTLYNRNSRELINLLEAGALKNNGRVVQNLVRLRRDFSKICSDGSARDHWERKDTVLKIFLRAAHLYGRSRYLRDWVGFDLSVDTINGLSSKSIPREVSNLCVVLVGNYGGEGNAVKTQNMAKSKVETRVKGNITFRSPAAGSMHINRNIGIDRYLSVVANGTASSGELKQLGAARIKDLDSHSDQPMKEGQWYQDSCRLTGPKILLPMSIGYRVRRQKKESGERKRYIEEKRGGVATDIGKLISWVKQFNEADDEDPGLSFDVPVFGNSTLLHSAVRIREGPLVKKLLDLGANPSTRGPLGESPTLCCANMLDSATTGLGKFAPDSDGNCPDEPSGSISSLDRRHGNLQNIKDLLVRARRLGK